MPGLIDVVDRILSGLGSHDSLELALRQLPGVTLVAFGDRTGTTVVELSVESGADREMIRSEATHLAVTALSGAVLIELTGDAPPEAPGVVTADATGSGGPAPTASRLRVRLLAVVPDGEPGQVRMVLAHRGRQVSALAPVGDMAAVVRATIEALSELGLPAPFAPESVHVLGAEHGGGAIVALRQVGSSHIRRGLASGRSTEEAAARATLNALNRYLQPAATDG